MAENYTRGITIYINGKEVENSIKGIRGEMQRMINAQAKMIKGSDEYVKAGKEIRKVDTILTAHRAQLKNTESSWLSLGKVANGFNKYFALITAGVAAFTGVVLGFRGAADAANKFEENLDNLSALTGLTGDKLNYLAETAKQASVKVTKEGVRIKQSAADILDAYTKVGSQRPELLQNAEALADVTEQAIVLGEASRSELAPAAAALTTTLNQFNLEADQSRRIINTLAAGSKVGAGEIPYLTEAIEKAGTTANLMNMSIEEMVGLVEAVAPKFSEARIAGNSLDKVMLKMREQNIGFKNGVFDMNLAMDQLREKYKSGKSAAEIFGVEHAKMAEVLVQSQDVFNKYTKEVTGTNIAFEQAAINTDNNSAKLAQAKNRLQLSAIELGERLNPAMVKGINLVNLLVKGMADIISIPLAEKLEEERIKVNTLTYQLYDANLSLEDRKKLLNELNRIAPDVAKNLDAEALDYELLSKNLEAYNTQMINKIILQRKDDQIESENEKVAKVRMKRIEEENTARMNMVKLNEIIQNQAKKGLGGLTGEDAQKAADAMKNGNLTLQERAGILEEIANKSSFGYNRGIAAEVENSLRSANNLLEKENELEGESNKLASEKVALMNQLGITPASASTITSGGASPIIPTLRPSGNKTVKSYSGKTPDKAELQNELDYINSIGAVQLKALEEFEQKKEALKLEYADLTAEQLRNKEIDTLQKNYNEAFDLLISQKDKEIITQEEYQDRVKQLLAAHEEGKAAIEAYYADLSKERNEQVLRDKLNKQIEYFSSVQALAQVTSDIFTSLQNSELNKVETDTNKKLKLAGDDSKKREKIQRESEEKQNQIKKKYADKAFNMAVAQIIANTAVAIMKAYADMGFIPGTIAALELGATGGIEVAKAKDQRDAVRQLARGKYDVVGNEDGRLYRNVPARGRVRGIELFNRPTLIGEHEPELAFDGPHTRRLMLSPYFKEVMALRSDRQMASGNYPNNVMQQSNTITNNNSNDMMIALLQENYKLLYKLQSGIYAKVQLGDIRVAEKTMKKIEDYASGKG